MLIPWPDPNVTYSGLSVFRLNKIDRIFQKVDKFGRKRVVGGTGLGHILPHKLGTSGPHLVLAFFSFFTIFARGLNDPASGIHVVVIVSFHLFSSVIAWNRHVYSVRCYLLDPMAYQFNSDHTTGVARMKPGVLHRPTGHTSHPSANYMLELKSVSSSVPRDDL